MEIKVQVDCRCAVRARLDERGEFKAEAATSVEYVKGRTAAVTLEIPEHAADAIRRALDAALRAVHEQLARAGAEAAGEAAKIARQRGEIQ
jgi:hypothetical protein